MVAAIFQPLSPCVVVGLAVLFRMERLAWRKAVGFVVGVGGAVVMVWPTLVAKRTNDHGGNGTMAGAAAHGDAFGMALLAIGVVGGAAYLLLMKRAYAICDPLALAAIQCASRALAA